MLMLAAMLALVVVPKIERWWRCYQLESATQEVVYLLDQLLRMAGERGEIIVVLVDYENGQLVAFADRAHVDGRPGSDLQLGPLEVYDQATGRTVGTVDEVIVRHSLDREVAGRIFRLGKQGEGGSDLSTAVEGFTPGPVASQQPRLVFEPAGGLRDTGTLYLTLAPDEQGPGVAARASYVAVSFAESTASHAEIRWYVAEPEGLAGYHPQAHLPEGARCCF